MAMDKFAVVKTKPAASKAFLSNAWASTTIILNQVPSIADGWNSLNEAKYKIEKFRVIMQMIRTKIDKLSDGVNVIEALKMDWAGTTDGEAEIMIRIRTEVSRLHGLHNNTKSRIDDLRISLQKTKRSLIRLQRHQRTNMLGSSIHFTTNLLEYIASEEAASSTFMIVQGLLVGLVIANGAMYWVAGKELGKPRRIKIEVLVLENRVDELRNAIVEAEKWIESIDPIELNG